MSPKTSQGKISPKKSLEDGQEMSGQNVSGQNVTQGKTSRGIGHPTSKAHPGHSEGTQRSLTYPSLSPLLQQRPPNGNIPILHKSLFTFKIWRKSCGEYETKLWWIWERMELLPSVLISLNLCRLHFQPPTLCSPIHRAFSQKKEIKMRKRIPPLFQKKWFCHPLFKFLSN